MGNYFVDRNRKTNESLRKIVSTLPDFCVDYFISIEQSSSSLTRLNYARDINLFFEFVSKEILYKDISKLSLNDINMLKSKNIDLFLSYVSDFEKNGNHYINGERGKSRKLSAIRSLFKYLYLNNLINQDETSKIKTPKLHTKPIIHLEPNEVVNLLDETENPIDLTKREISYNKRTRIRDLAMIT